MSQLIIEEIHGRVGLLRINRPNALNAINEATMDELVSRTQDLDQNPQIGAIVITGEGKAFVAGADIKEMVDRSSTQMYLDDRQAAWEKFAATRKPVIAAVNGFALGGGCELAMMCDIIFASSTAKFGQPEIKLGVIPGWGGSQRLTRAVGKAKAMDLILTGRMMDAQEAERSGLVSRIFEPDKLLDECLTIAQQIATYSLPAVLAAKEATNRAQELSLNEGIRFERRLFYSLFANQDKTEGMQAFIEKRQPEFKHK